MGLLKNKFRDSGSSSSQAESAFPLLRTQANRLFHPFQYCYLIDIGFDP